MGDGFSEAMLRKLHEAAAVRNRHGLEHTPVMSPLGAHTAVGRADGAVEVVDSASGALVRLFYGGSTDTLLAPHGAYPLTPAPTPRAGNAATAAARPRPSAPPSSASRARTPPLLAASLDSPARAAAAPASPPTAGWPAGAAHPATCEILAGGGARHGTARQPGCFRVRARDAAGTPLGCGGELLRASARGPAPMRVRVRDDGDDGYEVEYEAVVSGVYRISLTLGRAAHALRGSPVTVSLAPAPLSAPRCAVSGAGAHTATSGEAAAFRIVPVGTAAPDAAASCARGGGRAPAGAAAAAAAAGLWAGGIRVELVPAPGTAGAAVRGRVVEAAPGLFDASYTPRAAGRYALHVTLMPPRAGRGAREEEAVAASADWVGAGAAAGGALGGGACDGGGDGGRAESPPARLSPLARPQPQHLRGSPFAVVVHPARADASTSQVAWALPPWPQPRAAGASPPSPPAFASRAAWGARAEAERGAELEVVAGEPLRFAICARDRHGAACEAGGETFAVGARWLGGAAGDAESGGDARGAGGSAGAAVSALLDEGCGRYSGAVTLPRAGEYELTVALEPGAPLRSAAAQATGHQAPAAWAAGAEGGEGSSGSMHAASGEREAGRTAGGAGPGLRGGLAPGLGARMRGAQPLRCCGRVRVRVRPARACAAACAVTGWEGLLRAVAGAQLQLLLRAADAEGNWAEEGGERVSVRLARAGAEAESAEAEAERAPRWRDHGDGTYSLRWVETAARSSRVHVALGGSEVRGSPFALRVAVGRAHAPSCRLRWAEAEVETEPEAEAATECGQGGAVSMGAGSRCALLLSCRDEYGNSLGAAGAAVTAALRPLSQTSARAQDSADSTARARPHAPPDVSMHVADLLDGSFLLSCAPTVAGAYALAVTVDGALMRSGAPAAVLVRAGPPHAPSCRLLPLPACVRAGEGLALALRCSDRFGNAAQLPRGEAEAGGGPLALALEVEAAAEPGPAGGEAGAGGEGAWLRCDGAPLVLRTAAAAEGGAGGVAGGGGSSARCALRRLEGSGGADGADGGGGGYGCALVATRSGLLCLHATLGGRHVAGSPAACAVRSAEPDAARCRLHGAALGGGIACARGEFAVSLADRFGNPCREALPPLLRGWLRPVRAGAAASEGGDGRVAFGAEARELPGAPAAEPVLPPAWPLGAVAGAYLASAAGEYELVVALGVEGAVLAGCPLRLPIGPAADVAGTRGGGSPFPVRVDAGPTCAAASAAVGVATQYAAVGALARFAIQARDETGNPRPAGGDGFAAALVSAAAPARTVAAQLVDCADGTYLGTFTPSRAGPHELHVTLRGAHVRGSPYAVDVR